MTDAYIACERSTGIKEEERHTFSYFVAHTREETALSQCRFNISVTQLRRRGSGKPRKGRKPDHGGETRAVEKDSSFFREGYVRQEDVLLPPRRISPQQIFPRNSSKALRKSLDEAFSRSRLLYLRASSLYRHSAFYYLTSREKYAQKQTIGNYIKSYF